MAEVNPYAAPRAAVEDVQSGFELATRGERLGAAIVDGIVFALAGGLAGGTADWMGATAQSATFVFGIVIAMGGVGLINLWLLHRCRASIGKRALKIRMVRKDGSEAELWRLIVLRGLPQWVLSAIANFVPPVYALVMIDVLFIFGASRRCVHDYIADTIVVKAA